MLPSQELMNVFGLLLPRIMRKKNKLDLDLVPEGSIIRKAIVEDMKSSF